MKTTLSPILKGVIMTLVLHTNCAFATTITADASSGSDASGDGSSGNPYQTFHVAYTNAVSGDTISLSGTFDWTNGIETGDVSVTGYSLLKSLTIIGDSSGTTFIQSASSAGIADRCVFTINNDITFENLTIRYGYNTNQAENSGGITVLDDVRDNIVILRNCTIEENGIDNGTTTNYNFAGGIYLRGNTSFHPDLRLIECTLRNNSANGRAYGAGALYSLQSNDITIERSTFYNNSGTDASSFGVGYHNVAGAVGFFRFNTVEITNSTFTANTAETSGGAILSWYNRTFLTNNTIAYNSVTSSSGKGGGVYFVFMQQGPGNAYLKNNIIAQNTVNGVQEDVNFNTDSWASNIHDNGSNIIETFTGSSITPAGTGTITGVQANLNLSSTLDLNAAENRVMTLEIAAGSVAADAGAGGTNETVSVPALDQRGRFRSGTTDIGSYEMNGSGLPIELISFQADLNASNIVDLSWETLSEKDNDRFEVYRSNDGQNWQLLHTEPGAGNSQEVLMYHAEDRNPKQGVNYYLLKQVDFNGVFESFDIIRLEVDSDLKFAYPNPAKDFISISVTGNPSYTVLDYMGRVQLDGKVKKSGIIDISTLQSGAYILKSNGKVYPFRKE